MSVFIKRLNSHELGYRNGIPRGAGAFWLISKTCTSFFPTLSSSILNDQVIIEIQTNINININAQVIYEYHNSKYASTNSSETRDEYRLYMNQDINPNGSFFQPDDIVVLRENGNNRYLLYLFDRNNQYNSILNNLIFQYKRGNASAAIVPMTSLQNSNINLDIQPNNCNLFISEQICEDSDNESNNLLENNEEIENLFNEPIIGETTSTITSISRINRDSNFRRGILSYYNSQCAITRIGLTYGTLSNIEAAHIIAKGHGGGDNISNGIALSRDLHWAFDAGFFTITPEHRVLVHPQVLNSNQFWHSINGQDIFVPSDIRARPNIDALMWHNTNIYGLFLNR